MGRVSMLAGLRVEAEPHAFVRSDLGPGACRIHSIRLLFGQRRPGVSMSSSSSMRSRARSEPAHETWRVDGCFRASPVTNNPESKGRLQVQVKRVFRPQCSSLRSRNETL